MFIGPNLIHLMLPFTEVPISGINKAINKRILISINTQSNLNKKSEGRSKKILIASKPTEINMSCLLAKKNGIVVVISFHSLEDNIVKNFFKAEIKNYPKDIPINNEEFKEFECIAKKVRPSAKEIKLNNRSRSAIMRVFKKL